jgi:hypothetical protein
VRSVIRPNHGLREGRDVRSSLAIYKHIVETAAMYGAQIREEFLGVSDAPVEVTIVSRHHEK